MAKTTLWYGALTSNPDDYSPVADAFDHYMEQYEEAVKEADILLKKGKGLLNDAQLKIAGLWGFRYGQLQEIEQILSFLENREKRVLGVKRRQYREHYQRELTDSMVEKYADSDPELLDLVEIRNMFALVRNKYLGLTKHLEMAHYQIGHATKMVHEGVIPDVLL